MIDNQIAAVKTVQGIYDKAQLLINFPKIGYRHEQIQYREIRILLYGHYRIAYLIKDESHIDILGVFHGALDIDRFLF
ncbi:MAG: type II toxin-antitoxin system RelE/ParE family toxin [Candidatus Anammoxibacter sp.]